VTFGYLDGVRPSASRTPSLQGEGRPAMVRQPAYVKWRSWFANGVCVLVAIAVVYLFAASPIQWPEVWSYLAAPAILDGVIVTIELTCLAMAIGIALGIVLALMRTSTIPALSAVSGLYIWLFRGTPLLVQIIFWFNLALFIPRIGFGDFSVSTNTVMTGFVSALLALSLNEGAYMAEIVRGGILGVDLGQVEAARAVGMSKGLAMRRIVMPQALRIIVPATGNQAIGMLKATALVSAIGVQDLLTEAQIIYTKTYLVMELLIVASAWYLLLTGLASLVQKRLERRFSKWRGSERSAGGEQPAPAMDHL
jgi:polar amino acid transport system permease protein